jgi:protein farnesyltransferase subunit beta
MKSRAIETVLSFQHPDGGFCGGPPPGHQPHLLPTYASIMSLSILCGDHSQPGGGAGLSEMGKKAWDRVDRKGMYEFFMRCKRDDGGFVVCEGGEVDVR